MLYRLSMDTQTPPVIRRLSDLPLSILIINLDAAERSFGADSPTARVLARELCDRLAKQKPVTEELAPKK